MDTVLTLNIDRYVAESAEVYAKAVKKSVSQLVEEYLLSISSENNVDNDESLGPITRRLTGIIKLDNIVNTDELLTDALMEKYL